MDPSEIVKTGYNAIAHQYLAARLRGIDQTPLLVDLIGLIPSGGIVLDVGCGAGMPITKHLASYFRVLGVDFSRAQLSLARKLVLGGHFACQDIRRLGIARGSVDAICSFYAIIHVPRASHAGLLGDLYRILKRPGHALLCLGAEDLEEIGDYQGVPMYWSHFDASTYLALLATTGFDVINSRIVQDPIDQVGAHLFVLARKGGA